MADAPRLGLGMASLGRPGYINIGHGGDLGEERTVDAMRKQAHAVLNEAYELGLRYVDCARSYGLSEDFVASWLASRPEELARGVIVGSKWGYEYTADWRVEVADGESHEVKKHTVEQFTKQLAETRALLKSHPLSLYQIHSATIESGVLESESVLAALSKLKADGVAIGASVSHPQVPTLERIATVSVDGAPLFASVQATFNLLDQSALPALQALADAGVFVIIKEALANGRLTDRAPRSARIDALAAEAELLNTTMDALALAWVLSHDCVGMCLSGASTVEQLRANAQALQLAPLDAEVMVRLGAAARMDCEEYWAERRALKWN